MRKQSAIHLTITLIFSITIFNKAYSQKINYHVVPTANKLLTPVAESGIDEKRYSETEERIWNNINTKAIRNLQRMHSNANKVYWHTSRDGFCSEFKINNVKLKVYFDKRGCWTGTIRTYYESELSPEIRKIIKQTYYDYAIIQIDEVNIAQGPIAYIVSIDGEDSVKKIKVQSGEMETVNDFKK